MQALKLPARHGWGWLAAGFAIFRRNPPLLTMLVVGYWVLLALLNLIPLVGAIASTLCIPAFSVSLMNACRDLEQGRKIGPQVIFSGFRENLRVLLMLGAFYLAATLIVFGISAMADGGLLLQMMLGGAPPGEEALGSGQFLAATQIALILLAPLMMAYWYAPVLVAWHGFSVSKAFFFSFVACLRNWRAFFAYAVSLAVFVAIVPGVVLGLLAVLLPESIPFFTVLFSIQLLLIVAPTLFASFYVSYRDVFVVIEDDA